MNTSALAAAQAFVQGFPAFPSVRQQSAKIKVRPAYSTTHVTYGKFELECDYEYEPAKPAWGDDPPISATLTLIDARLDDGRSVKELITGAVEQGIEAAILNQEES
jgi:hypothetical protein